MTYGEAWYKYKQTKESEPSLEISEKEKVRLPRKMNNRDASRYYNSKLFKYWLSKLDERLNINHKKKILSALMFGNTDKYVDRIDLKGDKQ